MMLAIWLYFLACSDTTGEVQQYIPHACIILELASSGTFETQLSSSTHLLVIFTPSISPVFLLHHAVLTCPNRALH